MKAVLAFLLSFSIPAFAVSPLSAKWAPPTLQSPHWPSWAHQHWVWENEGTEESAYQLVDDYLKRDIPVAALIIDRPWDIAPSNLVPDPKRYPNLAALVRKLHSRDVKVMLWTVSLMNRDAPEFAEAKAKNYFLNGGRLVPWWAGWGGMLDYDNPQGVDWWHGRMNSVLDMGIDGWKLDGTDPFSIYASVGIFNLFSALSIWNKYREQYYTDFWKYSSDYTKKKFVITARPVDSFNNSYLPRLLDPFYSFAPYHVSFAGWVGDQDGNWGGMRAAIANMKESARRGFLSFGSDTTGFRSSGGKRDPELFARWAQLSTFGGVFENGGSGEHRPWIYSPELEAHYRKFVKIHHALVPYIFSSAAWAFENKGSLYLNFEKLGLSPGKNWDYLFGPALAVATLQIPQARRSISLPEGEWLDFFHPEKIILKKTEFSPSLDSYPVFIRNGAILPMLSTSALGPLSPPEESEGLNIILFAQAGAQESFPVYNDVGPGGEISYQMGTDRQLLVRATNLSSLGWLRIRAPRMERPSRTQVNGKMARESQWVPASENSGWWLKLDACRGETNCEIRLAW